MSHYLVELLLWVAVAYLLGCLLGWFLKNMFGSAPAQSVAQPAPMVARSAATPPSAVAKPVAPPPVHKPAPLAPAVAAAATAGAMQRPKGISAARGGKADDLQRINGVGPKNEGILHNLGFFHFDQIAAWTSQEVSWVDDHLKFNGRIKREEWIKQARLLADGNEKQFMQEFGTGGLKGKGGQTHSGSQTRKT